MMEKMNFVMFCLGAFTLAVGLVAIPYVSMLRKAIKSRIRRGKNTNSCEMLANTNKTELGVLKLKVEDLEKQVNNIAERLSTRDRNRKNNIRRDVRDYLEELKDGK